MPMTMIKLLQYYINIEVRVLGNICINDKKTPTCRELLINGAAC